MFRTLLGSSRPPSQQRASCQLRSVRDVLQEVRLQIARLTAVTACRASSGGTAGSDEGAGRGFQRVVNPDHVDKLVSDILDDLNKYGQLTILQSITLVRMPHGKQEVLDGQHRLLAFHRLKGDDRVSGAKVPVVTYECACNDDAKACFQRINSYYPIHALEVEVTWADKTYPLLRYIENHFKEYLVKTAKPQCPNVSLPNVKAALLARAHQLQSPLVTGDNLLESFCELHQLIRARAPLQLATNPRLSKCLNKNKDNPCFVALGQQNEWLDLILHKLLNNLDWGAVDLCVFSDPNAANAVAQRRRKSIPAALRLKVWGKINPVNSMVGHCYACNTPLNFTDMECAHDQPHVLGGESKLENLYPVCRMCNRDMGIQRLSDYRENLLYASSDAS